MENTKEQDKISVKHLNFYYGKTEVLKDLSIKVKANEILSVFGPANSGTTTLLRTMNRMTDLVFGSRIEGEILLDSKNIHSPDVSVTELRRKVGIVFEVPAPLPMSIFNNIAYGPRLSGIKNKATIEEIVEKSLRMAVLIM